MECIRVKNLKNAMLAANVGVCELAKLANLQQCLVSRWLKKEKISVRLPTLAKLSRALGVNADNLISEGV